MKRLRKYMFPLILGIMMGNPAISSYAYEAGTKIENAGKPSIIMREKGTNDARKRDLLPEEEVPYVLTVYNESDPVYVRVKVDVKSSRDFDDTILTGISTDWLKKSGYFYYLKPVQKEEEIIFSKGVRVPDLKRSDGEKFSISSEAQAVQVEGFLPDFTSDTPWGDEKELDFTEKVPEKGDSGDNQKDDKTTIDSKDSTNSANNGKNSSGEASKTDNKSATDSNSGNTSGNTSSGNNSSGNSSSGNNSSGNNSSSGSSKKSSSSGGGGSGSLRRGVSVSSDKAGIGPGFGTSNSGMYKNPNGADTFTDGQWQLIDKDQNHWSFFLTDGSTAKNGWLYLKNPYGKDEQGQSSWFKFNADGRMETGWVLSEDGNWYFAHDVSDGNLGVLSKGWHTNSQDKKKYYLHPETGHMLTGWQKIGEKYYYFATADDIPKQTWFFKTDVGKWLYDAIGFRSYGSMYQNERTPDGRLVDADGAYIQG